MVEFAYPSSQESVRRGGRRGGRGMRLRAINLLMARLLTPVVSSVGDHRLCNPRRPDALCAECRQIWDEVNKQ